jgi:hypothetical protein
MDYSMSSREIIWNKLTFLPSKITSEMWVTICHNIKIIYAEVVALFQRQVQNLKTKKCNRQLISCRTLSFKNSNKAILQILWNATESWFKVHMGWLINSDNHCIVVHLAMHPLRASYASFGWMNWHHSAFCNLLRKNSPPPPACRQTNSITTA